MPLATTYFIKAQIPGTTREKLLSLYQREILLGGATEAYIEDDMVRFSGGEFAIFNRHPGRFAYFTDGRLIIRETETEYLVSLEAASPRTKLFFGTYFNMLRNNLEQELQGLR